MVPLECLALVARGLVFWGPWDCNRQSLATPGHDKDRHTLFSVKEADSLILDLQPIEDSLQM